MSGTKSVTAATIWKATAKPANHRERAQIVAPDVTVDAGTPALRYRVEGSQRCPGLQRAGRRARRSMPRSKSACGASEPDGGADDVAGELPQGGVELVNGEVEEAPRGSDAVLGVRELDPEVAEVHRSLQLGVRSTTVRSEVMLWPTCVSASSRVSGLAALSAFARARVTSVSTVSSWPA